MTGVWISTNDCASCLGITEHGVRKKLKDDSAIIYRYTCGGGRGKGNRKIEILLSSLPIEAQAKYKGLNRNLETLEFEASDCTGKQKADANTKAHIVDLYQKSGMRLLDFLEWYNGKNGTSIKQGQFYSWIRKINSGGTAAVIDRRGGHNRGECSIPQDAWDYFYSMYMSQQKRGIQLCYDYTKKQFPDIPSTSTFRRRVKKIHPYAETYYREGPNALRDALPYMERDRTDISSNDIWFSDHHRLDIFSAEKGKVCRLWLTVFFDARSGKIISHKCRNASPNAVVIKECFKNGVKTYGVPKEIYFDNGADYRSRAFSNDYPLSLVRQLGVNTIYATPYHGQAKPVERFFRTLEERFGKMFPTYTGKDAKQRPEQMRTSDKNILKYAVEADELATHLDSFIAEYNDTPSRAEGLDGKSPNQTYYENLLEKKEVADFGALKMLCGTFEERTVQRNGVQVMQRYYEAEGLLPYYKKKVIVNYDHDNIDELNIFDMDMRFICTASARIKTPFRNTTEEDYKKAQKERKRIKKLVEEAKPVHDLDTIQLIARSQLEELQELQTDKNVRTTTQILPAFGNANENQQVMEQNEERSDKVTQTLRKRYQEELKRRMGG